MSSNAPQCDPQQPEGRPQEREDRLPAGYRVLHVIVPERVFNHVKAQAALSGMPFKTYMEHFLQDAVPYPPGPSPGPPNGMPSAPTENQPT
jgi:hypothetical protein